MRRAPLGEVFGYSPIVATGAQQIKHSTKHFIQVNAAWACDLAGTLEQGTNRLKLLVADITGILSSHKGCSLAAPSQQAKGEIFEQALNIKSFCIFANTL